MPCHEWRPTHYYQWLLYSHQENPRVIGLMILTVTPNSSLDRILFIDEWAPGLTTRIDHVVTAAGGKGLDASVSLSCQGISSIALTFVAGAVGQELLDTMLGYGVEAIPIWVRGETRVSYVVAERKQQLHTHITAGNLAISQGHIEAFVTQLGISLKTSSWMVCGGSLPNELDNHFYARLIRLARAADVPCLIDTSHLPIEPILQARPTILKMNRREFENAFGAKTAGSEQLLREGAEVSAAHHLHNLVITCGADGIVALTAEGVFHAQAPKQIPMNAAGAGDSVSGTLSHYLSQESGWPEALRQAAAVSAASVLTKATAECRMDDVTRILPQTSLTRLA